MPARFVAWSVPNVLLELRSRATATPVNQSSLCNLNNTTNMLQRGTRRLLPAATRQCTVFRPYSTTTDNPMPANNPNPKVSETQFAVSSSNVIPSSAEGSSDRALAEHPEEGERKRVMQAPNREGIWSRSQNPRSKAMVGPRFEQVIMEDQVRMRVC